MRVAIPMRRRVLWLALAAVALLVLLPLRLLIEVAPLPDGLGVRRVSGPVWAGRLAETRWHGAALGDLDASLAPLPLLVGRIRLQLSGDESDGALTAWPGGRGIDDFTGTVPADALFEGVPVTSLTLSEATVHFDDGRCSHAEGRVSIALAPLASQQPAPLAGTLRCEAGALLASLTGATGLERLELRVRGNGSWQARLTIGRGGDGAALAGMGFAPSGSGVVLERSGRF